MNKRDALEARYWQDRAAFWHEAALLLAEDIEAAHGAYRDLLVYKWTGTKNAERSAGIVARRLMGLA